MIEIDDRIIRPEPALNFLASDNLALTFKEQPQDLKHLLSEDDLIRIGGLNGS